MRNKKPNARQVKVPQVMQLEALECGAACLTMILAYWEKWIPLEQVRKDCGVNRDGSNALNVIKAGRSYGLKAQGYRYEPERLKKEGSFPCIIHWNFNHFVVLCGFKGDKAYINDPARGRCAIPMDVFDTSFTGIVMAFEPSETFEPSGAPKSIRAFVMRRVKGLKGALAFSILTSAVTALLGVISPIFNRIFYDRLLTGRSPGWATLFLAALCLLYVVQVVVELITAAANFRINGKINLGGNLSYMWKVLHLPMHFFSQRMTGDIVSRQSGNASVADTLVQVLSPILLNSLMMVFYLVVMLRYSWLLTLIGIATAVINMGFSRFVSSRRINLTRVLSRDNGKLSAATVAGIRMMDTLKSSGAEDGFFRKWAGCYATVNASTQDFARKNALWELIPGIVSTLTGSLMLGMGLYLTMQGRFTLGSLTAFQGLCSSFLSPVSQLIGAGQTIQEMRTQMERIDDVMEYPSDDAVKDIPPAEGEELQKLSGDVVIDDITFGYAPLSKPLIEHFSMHIAPGSRVAFVGASGCGKSTLSKLISGLYLPWSGSIRFDGKTVQEIDHGIFTGSLAVVDQEITLFEGTIADNIKMGDGSIEDFEMILAAKDAQLHYDILARPGGYQYRLTEGGRDLSGGQRQRLEIARVLAQEPRILILDEATSALDAKTEADVVQAIKDRGITCIVIAHRLSTIRDCDLIVVLDNGHVVEQGTHEELMAMNGRYASLVTNE